MKSSLSTMTEYPEKQVSFGSISYSILAFAVLPNLFFWLNIDFSAEYSTLVWFDIAFHGINFVAALIIFFGFLRDSFWTVRTDIKNILKHAAIGAACMLAVWFVCNLAGTLLNNMAIAIGTLPVAEGEAYGYTVSILLQEPLFGLPLLVFMAPITVGCLFYATVFAPIAYQKNWLAYVVMAAVLILPKVANAMVFWNWGEEMTLYLIQLPIHLIACRIYQKTDTVWTPIFALAMANGVLCILNLF